MSDMSDGNKRGFSEMSTETRLIMQRLRLVQEDEVCTYRELSEITCSSSLHKDFYLNTMEWFARFCVKLGCSGYWGTFGEEMGEDLVRKFRRLAEELRNTLDKDSLSWNYAPNPWEWKN